MLSSKHTELNGILSNINWGSVLAINNFDNILSNFYAILHNAISLTAPRIKLCCHKGPSWNNRHLINIKNKKNKYYTKYERTGLSVDCKSYALARWEYTITKVAYKKINKSGKI